MTKAQVFHVADRRPRNRLLAGLPEADYRRLLPDLTSVTLERNRLIQYGGEDIRHVYFPDGVFSVTAALPDGAMIEVASVGNEGMLGIEAFFGHRVPVPGHLVVEVSDGTVSRLDARVFRREIDSGGALQRLVERYLPFFLAQTINLAACNALHSMRQRLARWLLAAEDRLDRMPLRVSHEFLAMMLGARRPTISVAAAALQRRGVIRYSHGRLTVRDRRGLAAVACPCYSVLHAQLSMLREAYDGHRAALRLSDSDAVGSRAGRIVPMVPRRR